MKMGVLRHDKRRDVSYPLSAARALVRHGAAPGANVVLLLQEPAPAPAVVVTIPTAVATCKRSGVRNSLQKRDHFTNSP